MSRTSRRIARRRAPIATAAAVCAAAGLALASPAGAGPPADGVVMAELGGEFSEASARAVAERTGLRLRTTIPDIGWATYEATGDPAGARSALLRDPAVFRIDWVRPGEKMSVAYIPSDNIWRLQGTVGLNGQAVAPWNWHWVRANFPAAWDISKGSAGVKVAVIDSEFDTEHPDLKPKLATGRNFESGTPTYRTSDVRENADPTVSHGTHVAGLVGASTDNGDGVSGACFDCVVVPYKINTTAGPSGAPSVDAAFVSDLSEALTFVAGTDAAVVNMSLGTTRDHPPLRAAVALARAQGKVVVASAGNSQDDQPGVPNYPAAYDGVIAVAATLPDDNIAPFSTNGDYVDIAAPGSPILSTWDSRLTPQVAANLNRPDLAPTHGVGYIAISGTSMSSPIVAGLAAVMKTVRPDLSPDEVEALLEQSSRDLGAGGPDPIFGAGRIDAQKALQAAIAYQRPAPPPGPRRRAVRFFYSCEVGGRPVRTGRRLATGARIRARLVCKGRTQPALRKKRVEIQRFAARGGWRRIARTRTNNRGRFGFTVRLRTLGNYRVRVVYTGDRVFAPSPSVATRLRVLPRR